MLYPICSMYGIFTNIYPINDPNVGKYTIHGAYGYIVCHGSHQYTPVMLALIYQQHMDPMNPLWVWLLCQTCAIRDSWMWRLKSPNGPKNQSLWCYRMMHAVDILKTESHLWDKRKVGMSCPGKLGLNNFSMFWFHGQIDSFPLSELAY